MKSRIFLCLLTAWSFLQAPTWAADATLTLVPVGGTTVSGGQIVAVEAFVTTNRTIRFEGGQWDTPCTVAALPGGSGSLTATGGCTDCDGNGTNVSSGGIAFCFGPSGLSPYAPASCITATTPGIALPTVVINAGETRYLGTRNYQVSDCAAGSFTLFFECTDQPGGVCDAVPEATNTTRYREDEPPAPAQGPLLSLDMVGITLTVEVGSCCANDGGCIDDGVTESCCVNTLGGDHWHAGLLCDSLDSCHANDAGTGFTYQGFLEKPAGTPSTDTCTFEFKLCDDALLECAPGTVSNHPGIPVTDGVFTVPHVDFGAGAFIGRGRWMEVYVQCTGDGGLVALSPRVELTPAPYAIRALNGVGPPNTIDFDPLTGNVGIGTTTPAEKLHVVGNVEVQGTLFADALSSNSPLLLQTSGTTRIYANDVSGNVGIGTTVPEGELHVRGDDALGELIVTPGVANATAQVRLTENTTASLGAIMRYEGATFNEWQVLGLSTNGEEGPHLVIRRDSPSRVGIGRNGPNHPLHVGTDATNGNGAHCTIGGVWTNGSDRNSKQHFEDLDEREILNRLATLPITRWQYKSEPENVRHIGPVAQDFYAAFATGEDERYIGTIDADGVALAAIQGLYEVVKEKDCEMGELRELKDREIAELREQMAKLEAIMNELAIQSKGASR